MPVAPVLQALLVTFLWSTSWVLIKVGLRDLPALTFAGLRYGLAFLCLAAVVGIRPEMRAVLGALSRKQMAQLAALGVVFYALTQGAQFVALGHLPAATVSLLLSATPVVTAVLGVVLLEERTTPKQWFGIGVFVAGAAVYLAPAIGAGVRWFGLIVAVVGLLSNAGSSLMGRAVNRRGEIHPLVVTTVSMGVGGFLLLITGVAVQGLPSLDGRSWFIVAWLAVVNTAGAFTLWNHTLRALTATESSVINNTMLVQIAILAWIFLGEDLSMRAVAGIAVAVVGVMLVHGGREKSDPESPVEVDPVQRSRRK
jgi:drug/metabolite transporter (DMT)-like permease